MNFNEDALVDDIKNDNIKKDSNEGRMGRKKGMVSGSGLSYYGLRELKTEYI